MMGLGKIDCWFVTSVKYVIHANSPEKNIVYSNDFKIPGTSCVGCKAVPPIPMVEIKINKSSDGHK